MLNEKDIHSLKTSFENLRVLIGYEKASLPYRTMPCFVKSPDALKRLVTGAYMSANLVHYLNEVDGKVGVFVKSCDIPSVISLLQEGRFARQDIVLIGVVCPGTVDIKKVVASSGTRIEHISSIDVQEEQVIVTDNTGGSHELRLQDVMYDKCLSCAKPVPDKNMVDLIVGDESEAKSVPAVTDAAAERIAELEAMPSSERWEFWKEEMKRCIRCYACKNACSVCYCKRCIVDVNTPSWVSPANTWQDNFVYHIMRINHVAGRCTDCGECTRVCPVGIPLNLLTGKLFSVISDNFKQVPGENPDDDTPMTCFHPDDKEGFIY